MISYPAQDAVLTGLADKVLAAVAESVAATQDDLAEYRALRPRWVAEHSERGLANWVHDRLWAHIAGRLDGLPDVVLVDREPLRVFRVSGSYLVRVKRHTAEDRISSYPTQTALQFYLQGPQSLFPDLEEVRLAAGYVWDPDSRTVGDAVLSLRDGLENVVWSVVLYPAGGSGVVRIEPYPSGPTLPTVELPGSGSGSGDRADGTA